MADQFEMFESVAPKREEELLKTWREVSAWRCELCDFETGTADASQAHANEKEHELTSLCAQFSIHGYKDGDRSPTRLAKSLNSRAERK